jgi:hypothetical protein
MPRGPSHKTLSSEYYPHPGVFLAQQGGAPPGITPGTGSGAWYQQITVLSASASRLAALLSGAIIPQVMDEQSVLSSYSASSALNLRPPYHVFFQLLAGATNLVYLTWDNVTTPVAGSVGMELQKGTIYVFENARNLLTAKGSGIQQVNAGSAFQLIASTAPQTMNVWFSD